MKYTNISTSPKLFILAGMPGCGKTTWARTFFPFESIVSSDEIREEKWPGEPYDKDHNAEVFDEFHRRITNLLDENIGAIADATSLNHYARLKLLTIANYHDAEKHLIFFDNPIQAMIRNDQRTGAERVPREDQEIMYEKHRKSRYAILNEHYTSITIIEETS